MVYITVMQSPMYHQMTLDEFLFQSYTGDVLLNRNTANTRTYAYERVSERFSKRVSEQALIEKLSAFNHVTEGLRSQDRAELYHSFHIPKRSGGLRRIDAPNPKLMDALRQLKTIFEEDFHVLYHTSAFAYVRKRSTVDAIKRHQKNESKWFGKYDLSNFFGSTTLEFVMQQLSMIFPFTEIVKYSAGREELAKALELAFLNGGLPQGTPISPLITNLMMIPIDYKMSNGLRNFDKQSFVFTRYADDYLVSSKYSFDVKKVQDYMESVLSEFNAPFSFNRTKTRYGSSAGRNWNLGVMLNKDNEITIGNKKKRQFQSMLHNYITDKQRGGQWDLHDVQIMHGLYSYYKMVEPDAINNIVQHTNRKMAADVLALIKADLK